MKRLWAKTARVFWRPAGSDWASRLQADPIAPRRLEPRRLLDGGIALPVIEGLDAAGDAVQAGEADPGVQAEGEQAGSEQSAVAALYGTQNDPPSNLGVFNTLSLSEDGTASLLVSFSDQDQLDQHTLTIDWGDGSPIETINLAQGARFVVTDHQYLDDNPTGTSFDFNRIDVTITDSYGQSVSGSSRILVLNTAPNDLTILPVEMVDENGFATLRLSFEDPGTLDTHEVEIDWGDGTPVETVSVAPGARTLVTTHQYLDDNPTGTPQDTYGISVKVVDDDTGFAVANTTVLVKNVAPEVTILPVEMIEENGFATLRLTFDDPGTEDTHRATIDWGDGSPVDTIILSPGSRSLTATHQYLDDNPTGTPQDTYGIAVIVADDDTGFGIDAAEVLVKNAPPSNVTILPVQMIDENNFATLRLTFDDPGTEDTHEVEIDWGDGTPLETIALAPGSRSLVTTHQYLDDNPTGTPQDIYDISVRVIDDDTGVGTAEATVLVKNVAPSNVMILPVEMIDENGFATLRLTFYDPGTEDTHEVEIDWGDGTPVETVAVAAGSRSLVTTHQYLDDNPTGTPQDIYDISVKVIDDDTGFAVADTTVLVKNVPPSNVTILPVEMIDENGFATLRLTFDDPGTEDTHEVEIDWGDGSPVETVAVAAGSRSLVTTHQYLDDNPTGTPQDIYDIAVKVIDDDTGFAVADTTVLVKNVPPSNVTILPVEMIDENGFATLRLTFDDPGTEDTHEVEIDWGDGSPVETVVVTAGSRSLVTTHQYLDDNPTGTPQDIYDISVKVIDDDTGFAVADTTVLVKNVAPSNVTILPVEMIDENGFATLRLTFEDPGTEDTHEVEIDWGDGSPVETVVVAAGSRSLVTTHQYLDDNPTGTPQDIYDISVKVIDDDTGFAVADTTVLVKNVAPSNVTILPVEMIDENGFATLRLTFDDPGTEDTHEVEIDWGDGSPVETVVVAAGSRSLVTTHQYLDDNPTGTPQDIYDISVKVIDDDTGFGVADAEVLVKNVAPEVTILPVDMIEETGFATLRVTFDDPGTEDTHRVTVDWGDGSPVEVFDLTVGTRSLMTTHQYTDDNPTGTPQDLYDITVTVTDDDTGVGMAQTQVLVKNVAPSNVVILPIAMIEESQTAFLDLTFEDIGFEDTHTVEIDWGDGTPVETFVLPFGARSLSTSHTYVDDVPTGTPEDIIPITVRVIDDDTGVGVGNATVLVKNVAPTLLTLNAPDIDSSGTTTLSGTFNDPGADNPLANPETFESFVLEIDWGDGIVELVPISGPTPTGFSVVHVYSGPPDPMNPSADIEIKARIIDDDTGFDSGSVFVSNPGINDGPIVFVFNPETPRLTFDRPETAGGEVDNTGTDFVATNTNDIRTAAGDIQAATDRYFELRFRTESGEWSEGFRLKPQVLDDLPTLFLKLPDNRWAIFLIQRETNTERLVIEFDTRGGRVIDPGDDTEGARDRPPIDEPTTEELEGLLNGGPEGVPQSEASPEGAGPEGSGPGVAAAVGLAVTHRGSSLRAAAEGATAGDWRRLRRRMRKNRPSPR